MIESRQLIVFVVASWHVLVGVLGVAAAAAAVGQSKLKAAHFDEEYNFLSHPTKRAKSKDKKIRKLKFDRPTRELFALLCPPENIRKMSHSEIQRVQLFKDLLERMLTLDPAKRPTPADLLGHAFFLGDTARRSTQAAAAAQKTGVNKRRAETE